MLRLLPQFKFTSLSMARGALLKTVAKEYRYEYSQYEQEPTLMQQLKKLGYKILDDPKSQSVYLKRQFDMAKITIEFKATPPVLEGKVVVPKNEAIDNQSPSQQDSIGQRIKEKQSEYELGILAVDYTVLIESPKGEAIAFECNTSNQTTIINYVQPVYDIQEYQKRSKYRKFLADYSGPEINKLDDVKHLRTSMYNYLESFGINKQLNAFIEAYAVDKEQRLYMEFLKSMENFLLL